MVGKDQKRCMEEEEEDGSSNERWRTGKKRLQNRRGRKGSGSRLEKKGMSRDRRREQERTEQEAQALLPTAASVRRVEGSNPTE